MNDPLCHTPVRTPVCTPNISNAYFKAKMKIMPQNFQDIILWVYIVRTPVCTPDFSDAYISAKNEDKAMKLSGYDPLVLHST